VRPGRGQPEFRSIATYSYPSFVSAVQPPPTCNTSPVAGVTGQLLDPAFVDDFADRWLVAWNHGDTDAIANLCAEDIEYLDPWIGLLRGRRAVADRIAVCFRAFPDYHFEVHEPPYISRDRPKVIIPWRLIGTNTGPIEPPGFAATGRSFVIDGVDHVWFRDGLVDRYRGDYDLNDGLRQVGIVPPRGSRGEKVLVSLQRMASRLRGPMR
jgi:steroid delta-isomerase-like uncharacterized protein